MLNQFINFHRHIAKRDGLPESIKGLLIILGLSIFVFTVAQIWLIYSVSQHGKYIDTIESEINFQKNALTELTNLTAEIAQSNTNEISIEKLTEDYERKKAMMTILDGSIEGDKGFLPVLEGLARHDIEGVWLSDVSLAQGGGIRIEGYANDIKQIPLFAKSLSLMPAFTLVDFSKMNVVQGKDGDPAKFSLSSTLFVEEE